MLFFFLHCLYVYCPTVKLYPVTCEYIKGEKQFYYRAQNFYKDVPASEEGMMGDFVEISEIDLEGSRQFLKKFVVCNFNFLFLTECVLFTRNTLT